MLTTPIIQIGDERLHQAAAEVSPATIHSDQFQQAIAVLTDTMHQAGLSSLAAPQIGDMRRFFISSFDQPHASNHTR